MREIVLDTETTGLDARKGDRLIEVGCIELLNRIPSGREFHRFINPEGRDVHPDAERIHGISSASLKDKPVFAQVVGDFLEFIGNDTLVIHNASFDIGFLNAELARVERAAISMDRVVDTLMLARRRHPAGPNSLDALCKRYGIDNSKRTKHGALVDSLLLAEVYVELLGERQSALELGRNQTAVAGQANRASTGTRRAKPRPAPLAARLSEADEAAHRAFVGTLGSAAIWLKYLPKPPA
jgi:DNA polymerase-3 subunit epsilon